MKKAARNAAIALLFASTLLTGGGAAAQQPAPTAATATPAAPADERKWEVDKDGQRYYTERLAKVPGYGPVHDGRVTTPWGIEVEISGEDERYYYVRVYDRPEATAAALRKTWTAGELAAIAASYPAPLDAMASSTRLAFEPFDHGLPRRGQWRNGFSIADLDGDGALDLAHGPARKQIGPPVVFLGDRRGNWRRWREALFPELSYDYGDVAVADFDGNGSLDLAIAVHLRGVAILVQDGKGRFALRSEGIPYQRFNADPVAFSSRAIEAADWDGDGRIDVLAAGEGPRLANSPGGATSYGVAWYRNRGDGSWERKGDGKGEIFGESLALGDLDGDGDVDLAAGSSVSRASDLVVLSAGESRWTRAEVPQARAGFNQAVALGDFDGDRRLDLAVGYQAFEGGAWRAGLDLHLRRDGGAWERRGVFADPGRDRILSIAAGDLDLDGRTDLVAASSDGRVMVLRNEGDAAFTREQVHLVDAKEGCGGYHVEIADLDGDGRGDLAIGFAGEEGRPLSTQAVGASEPLGCADEGSLRAWRSTLASGGTPAAGAQSSR